MKTIDIGLLALVFTSRPKRRRRRSAPVLSFGDRFGRLVALERGPDYISPNLDRKRRYSRWWFRCDCGMKMLVSGVEARYRMERAWGCCVECYATISLSGESRGSTSFVLAT